MPDKATNSAEGLINQKLLCAVCSVDMEDSVELTYHYLKHSLIELAQALSALQVELFSKSCDALLSKEKSLSGDLQFMKTIKKEEQKRLEKYTGKKVTPSREPQQCEKCKKILSSRSNLKKHMIMHVEEKPFTCDQCPAEFNQNRDLKTHVMQKHSMQRPHLCRICGKGFVHKFYLEEHMAYHTGEKNYQCYKCGKRFPAPSALNKHMKRHTTVKQFKCEICSKMFAVKTDLKAHLKLVHERPPGSKGIPKEINPDPGHGKESEEPKKDKEVTEETNTERDSCSSRRENDNSIDVPDNKDGEPIGVREHVEGGQEVQREFSLEESTSSSIKDPSENVPSSSADKICKESVENEVETRGHLSRQNSSTKTIKVSAEKDDFDKSLSKEIVKKRKKSRKTDDKIHVKQLKPAAAGKSSEELVNPSFVQNPVQQDDRQSKQLVPGGFWVAVTEPINLVSMYGQPGRSLPTAYPSFPMPAVGHVTKSVEAVKAVDNSRRITIDSAGVVRQIQGSLLSNDGSWQNQQVSYPITVPEYRQRDTSVRNDGSESQSTSTTVLQKQKITVDDEMPHVKKRV